MYTTYTKFNKIALFVSLALLVLTLAIVDSVSADSIPAAYNVPTSMCHDPLLGPSMIIYNSDCDMPAQEEKESKQEDQTIVVPTNNETIVPPVVIINEVVKESPMIVPVDDIEDNSNNVPDMPVDDTGSDSNEDCKDKGNNGNHYGNDKPDNNPNDVNNKHDGEQTKEDHHEHDGKDK